MSFFKSNKTEITTKRLTSKRKKVRGQTCATPDLLNQIYTPNVEDATPDVDQKDNSTSTPSSPEDHRTEDQLLSHKHLTKELGDKYEYISDIGHGVFGKVVKARAKSADSKYDQYAIKIISKVFRSNQMAKRIIRELRILRICSHHEAIVELVDLVPPSDPAKFNHLSMVFEYMPSDLAKVFKSKQYFSNLHIKYILYQLLLGVHYIHSAGIVHRDLKPENIIINKDCIVRICDFGLARGVKENIDGNTEKVHTKSSKYVNYDEHKHQNEDNKEKRRSFKNKKLQRGLTRNVVSQWYRAPEVILLAQNRDTVYSIDIWSVGCIFGELLQMHHGNCNDYNHRNVLFPGKTCFPFPDQGPSESQLRDAQLRLVFNLTGTPTKEEINMFKDEKIRKYLNEMQATESTNLAQMYPVTKAEGIQLLRDMLRFDVKKRISVSDALKSKYFNEVRDESAEKKFNDQKVEIFEFEDIDIEMQKLRALIVDEIMLYNPQWIKQQK